LLLSSSTGQQRRSYKKPDAQNTSMSAKSRGSNAERDLIHKFWAADWAAMRAAGSGSTQFPSPDILAGNNLRKVAIECKLTTGTGKYFPKQEIDELRLFAQRFGAEPWVAIKYFRKEWLFFSLEDLEETPLGYSVGKKQEHRGISFEELIK